jgi:hypothetical protein
MAKLPPIPHPALLFHGSGTILNPSYITCNIYPLWRLEGLDAVHGEGEGV